MTTTEDAARLAEIQALVASGVGSMTAASAAFLLAELAKARRTLAAVTSSRELCENIALSTEADNRRLRTALEGPLAKLIRDVEQVNARGPGFGGWDSYVDSGDILPALYAIRDAASRPTPAPGDVDLQIAAAVLDGAARSFTPAPQETPKETQR